MEQVPTLLSNDEKLKNLTNAANTFNNLLTTIIEKLNSKQIERGDDVSNLKDSFPGNFGSIKIIPITEGEIKSIMHSLNKTKKKSSGYEEKTSQILKTCVPLSHPLSYIYNHSLYLVCIFPDQPKIATTLQERGKNYFIFIFMFIQCILIN